MSRSVTVITAREVYRYKMAYNGDKFLNIVAVTIVNNTDHTLHYATEDELQSRTFLINSAVCCSEERDCYDFKGLIHIQKEKMYFILYVVYVSSVADLDGPKKRVTPWSKRN